MSIGNFLESLSRAILVGIILVGRLGLTPVKSLITPVPVIHHPLVPSKAASTAKWVARRRPATSKRGGSELLDGWKGHWHVA